MPIPQSLEHVFVLMMENRSFDQLLGALSLEDRPQKQPIDGVSELRFNRDSSGAKHFVRRMDSSWSEAFEADPPHDTKAVEAQIASDAGNPMGHFIRTFEEAHRKRPAFLARKQEVMHYLGRQEQPVTYFLADHFAICQSWFCPVASGTIPNRLYSAGGSSGGVTTNAGLAKFLGAGFDSIFEHFNDWSVYSGSIPLLLALRDLIGPLTVGRRLKRLSRLTQHIQDANDGRASLPKVIWIEPAYSWSDGAVRDKTIFRGEANDDHPPSKISNGQELIAHIYDALVSAPNIWKKSALVITYDEHGGFYDHVSPPRIEADERAPGDPFQLRGPRVPTLVVSPFTEPGSVHGDTDPSQKNFYDHCSLLRFLCDWLDEPALSAFADRNPRIKSPHIKSLAEMLTSQETAEAKPLPSVARRAAKAAAMTAESFAAPAEETEEEMVQKMMREPEQPALEEEPSEESMSKIEEMIRKNLRETLTIERR